MKIRREEIGSSDRRGNQSIGAKAAPPIAGAMQMDKSFMPRNRFRFGVLLFLAIFVLSDSQGGRDARRTPSA